ncbi:MAG: hypothetical protein GQ536_03290 [Candidatus Aminicenantes bacterium]|nr:hypothetical protein [Candidatus Aminicenantes bacterium]
MKRLISKTSKWNVSFMLAIFLFAVVSSAGAQESEDLEATLMRLSKDVALGYISPVVSPFASNLNGGWFHKAPKATLFNLDVEVGLVGMGTFFPEDDIGIRHFSTSGDFRFNSIQATGLVADMDLTSFPLAIRDTIRTSLADVIAGAEFTVGIEGGTLIGDPNDNIEIEFRAQPIEIDNPLFGLPGEPATLIVDVPTETIVLEGVAGFGEILADINFLPFVAPQASIGTILGTREVFRYLPKISMPGNLSEDIGDFEWFGWGIQHNPKAIIPLPIPLDISFGFFKQTLKIGNIFEASTTAYGISVSKQLGVRVINLTPYAGYMIEKSKMSVNYQFEVGDQTYNVNIDDLEEAVNGENPNKTRLTFGCNLRLLLFNVNVDYNIGKKYNSVTVGLMFAL